MRKARETKKKKKRTCPGISLPCGSACERFGSGFGKRSHSKPASDLKSYRGKKEEEEVRTFVHFIFWQAIVIANSKRSVIAILS